MARSFAEQRWVAPAFGLGSIVAAFAIVEALLRADMLNRYILPLPSDVVMAFARVVTEEKILSRMGDTAFEVFASGLLVVIVGVPLGALFHRYRVIRDALETWVAHLAPSELLYSGDVSNAVEQRLKALKFSSSLSLTARPPWQFDAALGEEVSRVEQRVAVCRRRMVAGSLVLLRPGTPPAEQGRDSPYCLNDEQVEPELIATPSRSSAISAVVAKAIRRILPPCAESYDTTGLARKCSSSRR